MSLNSPRSANSSAKSNNNNKRKPKQKTLGMAWGANSVSSSKSASWKSPFSDFGSYMVEKNRKLRAQFDADASTSSIGVSDSDSKPLFHGVSIFVDGFTVPSNQELRGLMLKHGGRFENYFSRHRVTHIICSNLPDSKIKNLRSFSGGLPVVKPKWVLDCIAANKLLSWVPYQLDQIVNENNKQPKLSAFFASKSSLSSEEACNPAKRLKAEAEVSLSSGDSCIVRGTCEMPEPLQCEMKCHEDIVLSRDEETCRVTEGEECAFMDENYSELCLAGESSPHTQILHKVVEPLKSSPCKSSNSNNCCLDNENTKVSQNPSFSMTTGRHHSVFGGPNFVEDYFKNSRLHFIGTWRTRYRKRFPAVPGAKCGSPTFESLSSSRRIIHVDMDCFFVSVVIRHHAQLQDKPVAVCHSDNPRGTAEISSANYPARDYGVKAGIFVRDAKALCPHLVIVPYNFEAYEEVADQFYTILHNHCKRVQAVSCDEAFLDVTDREDKDPESVASAIRQEIVETTGCTASAGIAGNMLLARLATRTAKPNGQCFIAPEKVDDYINELPIKALPGIGRVLEEKLKKQHIQTCGQLRKISKELLQKDFGLKTGNMLWNYCRGVDNRPVGAVQETKSIGAEVNWGVRFNDLKGSEQFLVNLCNEVSQRLHECAVQGRTITLKVKKRKKNAEEPVKYMGCGVCENLSHSITVPAATNDTDVLLRISKQIFGSFQIDIKEIRGIGLQVSRLENAEMTTRGNQRNALETWLSSADSNIKSISSIKEKNDEEVPQLKAEEVPVSLHGSKQSRDGNYGHMLTNPIGSLVRTYANQPSSENEACSSRVSTLPAICDLDIGVLESLPPEIFSEVNEMYSGKLNDIIDNKVRKGKEPLLTEIEVYLLDLTLLVDGSEESIVAAQAVRPRPHRPCRDGDRRVRDGESGDWRARERRARDGESGDWLAAMAEGGRGRADGSVRETVSVRREVITDFMPSSLSQVDVSVLEQLPDDLKINILEVLPAHRMQDHCSDCHAGSAHECAPGTGKLENCAVSSSILWIGNPPVWVDNFDDCNHLILKLFAKMYYQSGSTGRLSSILQSALAALPHFLDASIDSEGEVISILCELLQQYVDLKIKSDLEELYISFRLLRRFTFKSSIFMQIYDIVLPYLQFLSYWRCSRFFQLLVSSSWEVQLETLTIPSLNSAWTSVPLNISLGYVPHTTQ
ncbi:hypothetical protein Syun_004689 [Stephania yunnanensis]|uniref:DNA repair protein REV1 n=1 Tax=Stephania yunnanensis TaxID=152371 RepID=A0AAP0L4Z9_9MAGN